MVWIVRTSRRTLLPALLLCVALLTLALVAGAGRSKAGIGTPNCSKPDPTGRQFCVTITDQDNVSPSGPFGSGKRQVDVTAYQYYEFFVENKGGSTLTNGTLSATLTDHVVTQAGASDVPSTALFVPAGSAPYCKAASTTPNTVSCLLPNMPANSTLDFFLAYRTSTTANVTATALSGVMGFKEGANGPNGANPATINDLAETTVLEPDPESSVAWSPTASNVQMGTSPTFDSQWSTLQYKVPSGEPSFLADMNEGVDDLCPSALAAQLVKKCFSGAEKVTTVLSAAELGTFSQTNPFHLTINIDQNLVTGNLDNVKMIHRGDSGTEIISLHCAHTPPLPTDTLPCITVGNNPNAKTDVINAYGFQNGGWVPGL
jgi:hypothetical protein